MKASAGKTSAKTPRYLDAASREDQILHAAIEFVADRGLAFTTRDLAAALGVTQPLLYRYFRNKDALIDRIFEEVYMRRWRPEWNELLRDRSKPVQVRLELYLRQYTRSILEKHWIRIFIISAFEDPVIAQKYLDLLHSQTFRTILEEIAHENRCAVPDDPVRNEIARELIWGFHSSFFYMGVRKYIYRLDIPDDIDAIIRIRVKTFLDGIHANVEAFLTPLPSAHPHEDFFDGL